MSAEATPMSTVPEYPARLTIDYPEQLDRLSTALRLIWIIPIGIIFGLLSDAGQTVTNTLVVDTAGDIVERTQRTSGGLVGGLAIATALMIIVRQRYPRWWFDFARELTRFGYRVGAYFTLLTDRYPSTVEEQAVHLEIDYPDAERDLNRWMPLIKWLLALPHYIILGLLGIGVFFAVMLAWVAILATGRYPRALFDFVVGVGRWALRVNSYTIL
ncbi:MAG TPA: DUF4389 domain-containing protein, partial [Roseiflexaceae bacterium]|nr:DUF4389 domain-containing protein [Roseiflexaceae bacterium]